MTKGSLHLLYQEPLFALGNVCVSENSLSSHLAANCSLKGASPVRSTLGCQRESAETDAFCLANSAVLISTMTAIFLSGSPV